MGRKNMLGQALAEHDGGDEVPVHKAGSRFSPRGMRCFSAWKHRFPRPQSHREVRELSEPGSHTEEIIVQIGQRKRTKPRSDALEKRSP
jgi:hypothetical protein